MAGTTRGCATSGTHANCVAARESLSAILDGEIPAAEDGPLDGHLRGCRACRAWYRSAAEVDKATCVVAAEPAGADLAEAVLRDVPLPRRSRWRVPLAPALIVVALGVASAIELSDGNVGWSRLVTHAPVILGLLLIMGLSRQPHARTGPAGAARPATPAAR